MRGGELCASVCVTASVRASEVCVCLWEVCACVCDRCAWVGCAC